MLCVAVVAVNCACIWINCSIRLLLATFELSPDVEAVDDVVPVDDVEPVDDGAVVNDTDEPSAKLMVVVDEPLLLAVVWLVPPAELSKSSSS